MLRGDAHLFDDVKYCVNDELRFFALDVVTCLGGDHLPAVGRQA